MRRLTRTLFVTDVEGQLDYFRRLVGRTKGALSLRGEGEGTLRLADDTRLCYGGDAFDRGPGDLRFGRLLLAARREYGPERVVLIKGNRDINKMRLSRELPPDPEARVEPLRWMLERTMGAPRAFEHRRAELRALGEPRPDDVAVAASFARQFAPHGFLGEYLREARLAAVVGDTLFVHGSVSEASLGRVPGQAERRPDVPSWVAELNIWGLAQVADWRKSGGGAELIRYASRGYPGRRSVVHADFMGDNGNPRPLPPAALAFLAASGVRRVVVGHKPNGDCPASIVHADGLTVLSADTGYSDPAAADSRGCAASVVTLWDDGRSEVEGVLACGREHRFELPADPLVGRPAGGGFWGRSRLRDDASVLVRTRANGFDSETEFSPCSR